MGSAGTLRRPGFEIQLLLIFLTNVFVLEINVLEWVLVRQVYLDSQTIPPLDAVRRQFDQQHDRPPSVLQDLILVFAVRIDKRFGISQFVVAFLIFAIFLNASGEWP